VSVRDVGRNLRRLVRRDTAVEPRYSTANRRAPTNAINAQTSDPPTRAGEKTTRRAKKISRPKAADR